MGPSALPPEAVSNLEGLAQRLRLLGHDPVDGAIAREMAKRGGSQDGTRGR
jgi:hypothetical protein